MRALARTIISLVVGLCCSAICNAQSPKTAKPDRVIGKAEVYSFTNPDRVRAQVKLYVVGDPNDLNEKKDALVMEIGFEVPGKKVTKPKHVQFIFHSYSSSGLKYKDHHKLDIGILYLDGSHSFAGDTRIISSNYSPTGISTEKLIAPRILYSDFVRMVSASRIEIALGRTVFELKKGDFEAFKDLTKTIEK